MNADHLRSFAALLAIYLIVQGMGLWISFEGPGGSPGIVESIKEGESPGVVSEPEKAESSAQIFLYVIASTALLLVLLKYKLDFLIRIFISLSMLGGLAITLMGLAGLYGIFAAVILFAVGVILRRDAIAMNLVLIFTLPGVGSWLGASLSFLPALILLLGLAIYDIIAVYGTKHMVTLAEGARDKIPLMFSIPIGDRYMGLGTGDLAIPLVFSVSVLRDYGMQQAMITSAGGLIGLAALYIYITTKKDVVLPALPPLAAGLLIGYGISAVII